MKPEEIVERFGIVVEDEGAVVLRLRVYGLVVDEDQDERGDYAIIMEVDDAPD